MSLNSSEYRSLCYGSDSDTDSFMNYRHFGNSTFGKLPCRLAADRPKRPDGVGVGGGAQSFST